MLIDCPSGSAGLGRAEIPASDLSVGIFSCRGPSPRPTLWVRIIQGAVDLAIDLKCLRLQRARQWYLDRVTDGPGSSLRRVRNLVSRGRVCLDTTSGKVNRMSSSQRCDEILRIIDEVLGESAGLSSARSPSPSPQAEPVACQHVEGTHRGATYGKAQQ